MPKLPTDNKDLPQVSEHHNIPQSHSLQDSIQQPSPLQILAVNAFLINHKNQPLHTALIPLNEILPEDPIHRKHNPNTPALICLQEDNTCHASLQCIPKLATRIHHAFQQLPHTLSILLLFTRDEKPLLAPAFISMKPTQSQSTSSHQRSYIPPASPLAKQQPTQTTQTTQTFSSKDTTILSAQHNIDNFDFLPTPSQTLVPKKRVWCLSIHRDFANSPNPYKLFRTNYNSILLVTQKATYKQALSLPLSL